MVRSARWPGAILESWVGSELMLLDREVKDQYCKDLKEVTIEFKGYTREHAKQDQKAVWNL